MYSLFIYNRVNTGFIIPRPSYQLNCDMRFLGQIYYQNLINRFIPTIPFDIAIMPNQKKVFKSIDFDEGFILCELFPDINRMTMIGIVNIICDYCQGTPWYSGIRYIDQKDNDYREGLPWAAGKNIILTELRNDEGAYGHLEDENDLNNYYYWLECYTLWIVYLEYGPLECINPYIHTETSNCSLFFPENR